MERPEELDKDSRAEEPFPPTHSTLNEPAERAALDDGRLADRQVGSSLRDQEIAGRAISDIAEDGAVNLGDGLDARIQVKSEGRIVTISGTVDCAGERMAAEEMVEAVPGVELVQNALTVAVDSPLDDGDLETRVRKGLDDSGFPWLGVKVSRGVARLMGTAEKLADVEHAIKTAAGVKGIRDVVSNVRIRMPDYTDDEDLASLVAQSISLDGIVVMDREIRVHKGVVRVSGKVRSLRDGRRIRSLVGEIAGVRAIKDHLQVDHALFRDWLARTHLSSGR